MKLKIIFLCAITICLASCFVRAKTAIVTDLSPNYEDVHNYEEQMMRDLAEANKIWDSPDTTGVSQLSIQQVLKRILPQAKLYAASDSTQIFYNNIMQLRFPVFTNLQESSGDSTIFNQHVFFEDWEAVETLAIGKFIDGKQTFAIAFSVPESLISFYRIDNGRWKEIGRRREALTMPYGHIYFEEMNNKPGLEIVFSTWPPNSNGNTWMEVYTYFEKEDSIKFAGDFSTNYTVNLKDTTVREEYGGSWYMDQHQTLYVWHNDMMVPKRVAVMVVPTDFNNPNNPGKDTLEYYENPEFKYCSYDYENLQLIFREEYNKHNKKHRKYWDDFFDLK